MCLRYCSDIHPVEAVREASVYLSPDELKADHITIRDSGWAPGPNDLEALSSELGTINLEWKYWVDSSPPISAFEDIVSNQLANNLPIIAIVDAKQIQGLDSTNGQHAVVITGLGKSHVILNDPWGGKQQKFKLGVVVDAWDTRLNRLMILDVSNQESLQVEFEPPAEAEG